MISHLAMYSGVSEGALAARPFERSPVGADRVGGGAGVARWPAAGAAADGWRAAFHRPLHLSALLVIHGHIQPGVRIRPLPFLDDAGKGHHLIHLISRVAVVGAQRNGTKQHYGCNEYCDDAYLHD